MYRAQLLDATHLVMHWHIHHDGAAHWRSWKRAGRPMPIAICFGGESVLPYAATAPLPPGMSELAHGGFSQRPRHPDGARTHGAPASTGQQRDRHRGVRQHRMRPHRLASAPPRWKTGRAGRPRRALSRGPFGDHTGFYSLPDRYPIVEVTAVTHRRAAVFPATIVGPPPQEDYYLGKATERIFLPLLRVLVPDIEDYHLPLFGCFHNCAFVRDQQAIPAAGAARHARDCGARARWRGRSSSSSSMTTWTCTTRPVCCPRSFVTATSERDTEAVDGPLDILDHAAPRLGAGGKLGIDATRKIPGEEIDVSAILECQAPATGVGVAGTIADRAVGRAGITAVTVPDFGRGRCVFVGVDKSRPGQGEVAIARVWSSVPAPAADLVVAVDAHVDLEDWQAVLFHLCANTDTSRDLVRHDRRLGIDATTKIAGDERHGRPVRDYPPILEMTEEIRRRVAARRPELGFA